MGAGLRIPRLWSWTLQAIRIPQLLGWISLWRLQIWCLRILRIRLLRQNFDICPDTTQMCSESQSLNLESHLSKSSETKKSLKIKHLLGRKKKKKKKKNEKKKIAWGKKKKKKKKKS